MYYCKIINSKGNYDMPAWAIHFRVADMLLDKINGLNTEYFLIGNIAPDCGVPVSGQYNPPTGVTHFTAEEISNKSDCDYDYIYNKYVKDESDINKKSFFTGYFVHLYTDCQNAVLNCFPIEEKYGKFRETPGLSAAVRREWNNIDFEFFKKNKSPSFEIFKKLDGFEESYPEWYKNGEIPWQMKNIVSFYENNKPKYMKYKYANSQHMSDFVVKAAQNVYEELSRRGFFK